MQTPPSLFGIDRRIAYVHKKYHSGLMWGGVTSGLAGRKLSGSENKNGNAVLKNSKARNIIKNPNASLAV